MNITNVTIPNSVKIEDLKVQTESNPSSLGAEANSEFDVPSPTTVAAESRSYHQPTAVVQKNPPTLLNLLNQLQELNMGTVLLTLDMMKQQTERTQLSADLERQNVATTLQLAYDAQKAKEDAAKKEMSAGILRGSMEITSGALSLGGAVKQAAGEYKLAQGSGKDLNNLKEANKSNEVHEAHAASAARVKEARDLNQQHKDAITAHKAPVIQVQAGGNVNAPQVKDTPEGRKLEKLQQKSEKALKKAEKAHDAHEEARRKVAPVPLDPGEKAKYDDKKTAYEAKKKEHRENLDDLSNQNKKWNMGFEGIGKLGTASADLTNAQSKSEQAAKEREADMLDTIRGTLGKIADDHNAALNKQETTIADSCQRSLDAIMNSLNILNQTRIQYITGK